MPQAVFKELGNLLLLCMHLLWEETHSYISEEPRVERMEASICGHAGTIFKSTMSAILTMKDNSIIQARYQKQVTVLVSLLESIQKQLDNNLGLQSDRNILVALGNLEQTVKNGVKLCQEFETSNKVSTAKWKQCGENLAFADSQTKALDNLDREFTQATNIANLAIQLLTWKIQELHNQETKQGFEHFHESLHPSAGVFAGIGEEPAQVTNVNVKPSGEYLVVSWNDEANENLQIKKYQIRLNRSNLIVERECEPWNASVVIRIADRVKPWSEYSVQVRAVNDAGRGTWSEPAVDGLMDLSPPTKPCVRITSAPTSTSVSFQIDRPELYTLQEITHCVIKKRTIHPPSIRMGWEREEVAFVFGDKYTDSVKTVHAHDLQTRVRYKFQISLRNQWGESEPSLLEMTHPIAGMRPGSPRKIFFAKESRTHDEVWVTWKPPKINVGSIDHYVIEKRKENSTWEDATDSVTQLNLQVPPHKVSKLNRFFDDLISRVDRGERFYSSVMNLKQNTTYYFRVCGVNLDGIKGDHSDELKLQTRIHPAAVIIAASFLNLVIPGSFALSLVFYRYGPSSDKYKGLQEPSESDDEQ